MLEDNGVGACDDPIRCFSRYLMDLGWLNRLLNPQWPQPGAGRTPAISTLGTSPGSGRFLSALPLKTKRGITQKPALALRLLLGRGCVSHVGFSSAGILWERLGVIYFPQQSQGILSIVSRARRSPAGRRRGQSQGREQSSARLTQRSQPGAAVNRISSKVTSSGSHCSCQRKLQSFFSPLKRRARTYSATVFLHVPGL